MTWRAVNYSDEIAIDGETYGKVCKHIKDNKLAGEWVIEFFDSNHLWIEMEKVTVEPTTGDLQIVRASHLEHI